METFESGLLDLPDFYFTGDDYRYRFEPEAKQRFLDLLRESFNSGAKYKGRALKWDTVTEQKTLEFAQYLVGRTSKLDFSEPPPNLHGMDDRELRRRIHSLTQREARRLGIGKSTLHSLRRNAERTSSLKTYRKTQMRLSHMFRDGIF
jgi:hypothetical protein